MTSAVRIIAIAAIALSASSAGAQGSEDERAVRAVVGELLDLFGPRRCMWGSNFPIEKLWTDLDTLVKAWQQALSPYPPEARREVFSETARRVYRLR
jgi:predicted TIM-barrel fold metal-dependent hydrolase